MCRVEFTKTPPTSGVAEQDIFKLENNYFGNRFVTSPIGKPMTL